MAFDSEKYVEKEDFLKLEKKYNDLVERLQSLFLDINNRYYVIMIDFQDFNDINEKLNRKSNEFNYTRLDPYRLIDLIKEMLAIYIK